MSLQISEDGFAGAYSSFALLRNRIAWAAGYEVVSDFRAGRLPHARIVADPRWADANFMGEWEMMPQDALLVLLVHSDCEGIIPWGVCRRLELRLREIASWCDDDPEILRLAEACHVAFNQERDLVFS